jgi:hypothetical protein
MIAERGKRSGKYPELSGPVVSVKVGMGGIVWGMNFKLKEKGQLFELTPRNLWWAMGDSNFEVSF